MKLNNYCTRDFIGIKTLNWRIENSIECIKLYLFHYRVHGNAVMAFIIHALAVFNE